MKFKATYKEPGKSFALALEGNIRFAKGEKKVCTKKEIIEFLKQAVSEELHNSSTNKGYYSPNLIKIELIGG